MAISEEWRVGDVRVVRLAEIEARVPSSMVFGEQPMPEADWLRPHWQGDDGRIGWSMHAFLIEERGRRMVVDTCLGNDKVRSNPFWNQRSGPFLSELRELGFAPESIERVLCTHLHFDHVGWNTRLVDGKWIPTFPNARYWVTRAEWEHASAQPPEPGEDPLGDSVRPLFAAELVDLVESDARVSDAISFESTPGHTPGHVAVRIRSRGEEAVITGDLIHHPAQIGAPEVAVAFDWDAELALRTRRAFVREHANRAVLVLGTHFHTPAGGWIVADAAGNRFVPSTQENVA
jgi:glyoxylase-like metal-dependent hydrolase (beta-lactamase superfamily II)